jgi:hypothetical protein
MEKFHGSPMLRKERKELIDWLLNYKHWLSEESRVCKFHVKSSIWLKLGFLYDRALSIYHSCTPYL